MSAATVSAGRPAGRTAGRKNPLRVVTEPPPLAIDEPLGAGLAPERGAAGRPRELTAPAPRR
jgi:hypothetical protein